MAIDANGVGIAYRTHGLNGSTQYGVPLVTLIDVDDWALVRSDVALGDVGSVRQEWIRRIDGVTYVGARAGIVWGGTAYAYASQSIFALEP